MRTTLDKHSGRGRGFVGAPNTMSLWFILLFSVLEAKGQIADIDRLEHDLSKFLSMPRYNSSQKSWTRMGIRHALDGVGLQTISHTFTPDEGVIFFPVVDELGVNLLSIQRGPHYDTSDDKVVVICANYDTEENSPGVDDNGSGVAAVLETARAMATLDRLYQRNNTIIYAFFDMKHQIFPTAARELYEHNHMGDFIQLIGRIKKDDVIVQQFLAAFARSTGMNAGDWSFRPWLLLLRLPVQAINSVEDMYR
ncbi:hypothetical protein ANCDUO_13132 [Ancylostoma duodenale]|uniref:Peptidase M28 domain-containing protein n=1 Tax=Ancylostoma duodenale TaxID=51022 RepID=A0A0C2D3Q9_9BILA|nr:hypothetical protein ANCDUO_13132 [Ancylostoma duodenale]